jgi:hypothetical protein
VVPLCFTLAATVKEFVLSLLCDPQPGSLYESTKAVNEAVVSKVGTDPFPMKRLPDWLAFGTVDRVLLCILAPLVTAFEIALVYGCHRWEPGDALLKVLKYLLMEVGFTTALFGALVCVWAIARPRWVAILLQERLLWTMLLLGSLGPVMVVFALLVSRS